MDKRKYFLIVNLIAGRGRCKALFPKVKEAIDRHKIDYDLHYTNEPLEAVDVAKMGIEAGFTHIIAMGGDGTVNEVANGIVAGGGGAILGVIPAGLGNDFIRMLGIPPDPSAAIEFLLTGHERWIDLGQVAGDRYFVNGLGIGIDAQVARDVFMMERVHGTAAYIYAAIKQVFRFKAFPAKLRGEDWEAEYNLLSLGLANGKYCGGGFKLTPRADLDDGLVDIAAIEDFPRLERFIRLPQARNGTHLKLSKVHYRQEKSVTVSSPTHLVAHIDGEPYRLPEGEFTVNAVPHALQVIARA